MTCINKAVMKVKAEQGYSHTCLTWHCRLYSRFNGGRALGHDLNKTLKIAKTIKEPDSRTPTTSNWRSFFSSNPTRRRRSLISSLPIHPQIGSALISNPTRQCFNSSRTTRRHFFSAILNRRNHPQSSGSLFTYD